MTPVPPPRRRDPTNPDDFDWPPTADELSVYELGPDPWQKLQDASSTDHDPGPAAPEPLAEPIA